MKAVVETKFYVRGVPRTTYYSFPVYSNEIEATMIRELEFLQRHGSDFSLDLRIIKNSS